MFGDGSLAFHEFASKEPLPLAFVHDAVLDFLRGRDDAALRGSQAVNAYVSQARMTEDVDILSTRAAELAEEIRDDLVGRLPIDIRVREVRGGLGFRVDQVREPKGRHLVDVTSVESLPETCRVQEILIISPPELIASKLTTYHRRRGTIKSFTDWRDLMVLLLTYPELKANEGLVRERLLAAEAEAKVFEIWRELVAEDISEGDEDDEFGG